MEQRKFVCKYYISAGYIYNRTTPITGAQIYWKKLVGRVATLQIGQDTQISTISEHTKRRES